MANSTVTRKDPGVPFLVRVLWFFLVGWHVTLYWIVAAWFLNLTILGMPLGLWMLNRAPIVLTLRMPRGYNVAYVRNGQVVDWRAAGVPQAAWPLRALYFLVIGWWFSLVWSLLGWLLCVSIIGLPFGLWMLNRLPNVTTMANQG